MGSKFVEEALQAHNKYRKLHGVPPLTSNKDITAIAQKYAEHLAKTNSFNHSDNSKFKGQPMGENLAMRGFSNNEDFTGDQATKDWYDEIKDYNFKTHNSENGRATGHFTQVVWKGSKELGIGKAKNKNGEWLVVANYYPAGNYVGNHPENVFPVGGEGSTGGSKPVTESKSKSEKPTKVSTTTSKTPKGGKSVHTSTKTMTETKNGKKVTRNIVTETTTYEDGSKSIETKETITEH